MHVTHLRDNVRDSPRDNVKVAQPSIVAITPRSISQIVSKNTNVAKPVMLKTTTVTKSATMAKPIMQSQRQIPIQKPPIHQLTQHTQSTQLTQKTKVRSLTPQPVKNTLVKDFIKDSTKDSIKDSTKDSTIRNDRIKQVIQRIEKPYHSNWVRSGTLLIYRDATYQFKSRVIITELEECLIQKISDRKLYDKFNVNNIQLQDVKFIKRLISECSHGEKSLVILSNQVSNNKLQIDGIKQKFEAFLDMARIPVLAIFALAPDRYMKPHTGMWTFLCAYYKRCADGRIINKDGYSVVGQEGGQIVYTKHGATTKYTDVDRAFAYNIKAYFYTPFEYMNQDAEEEEFTWSHAVLEPKLRKLYVANLLLEKRVNILEELISI